MILKGFQTCYGHSLFFYDKVQKPKLKENQKIPVLQHTSLSSISSLAVNSYCHGFKATVKHLGIWWQSHQMALFHSARFITNYTKLPIRYHLPATPPWRVSSFIFPCYFPSSSQAWHTLSPSLPPILLHSNLSMESMPHRKPGLQNRVLRKCADCQMLKRTFSQVWAMKHIRKNKYNVDRVAECLDAYDYDHKSKKSRLQPRVPGIAPLSNLLAHKKFSFLSLISIWTWDNAIGETLLVLFNNHGRTGIPDSGSMYIQVIKLNKKTEENKLHSANDFFSGIMQSQRNKRPVIDT